MTVKEYLKDPSKFAAAAAAAAPAAAAPAAAAAAPKKEEKKEESEDVWGYLEAQASFLGPSLWDNGDLKVRFDFTHMLGSRTHVQHQNKVSRYEGKEISRKTHV